MQYTILLFSLLPILITCAVLEPGDCSRHFCTDTTIEYHFQFSVSEPFSTASVDFYGFMNSEEMSGYHRELNVILKPSRWANSLSIAICNKYAVRNITIYSSLKEYKTTTAILMDILFDIMMSRIVIFFIWMASNALICVPLAYIVVRLAAVFFRIMAYFDRKDLAKQKI